MDTSAIQKKIMFRIYGIWFLRRVAPVVVFEMLFVALAIQLFAKSVFIARVIENAGNVSKGNPWSILYFVFSAVLKSRLEVKLEIALAALMGALFLWSIKRAIVSYEVIRQRRTPPKQGI